MQQLTKDKKLFCIFLISHYLKLGSGFLFKINLIENQHFKSFLILF